MYYKYGTCRIIGDNKTDILYRSSNGGGVVHILIFEMTYIRGNTGST